jgi:hypothetical protein
MVTSCRHGNVKSNDCGLTFYIRGKNGEKISFFRLK